MAQAALALKQNSVGKGGAEHPAQASAHRLVVDNALRLLCNSVIHLADLTEMQTYHCSRDLHKLTALDKDGEG